MTIAEFVPAVDAAINVGGIPPGVTHSVAADSGTWRRGLAFAVIAADPQVGPLLLLRRDPGGAFGHMSQAHPLKLDAYGVTSTAGIIAQFLGFYGTG
jgi:hypothetical protein